MCRILIAYGRLSHLRTYYSDLTNGIMGASYYDPYQVKAYGAGEQAHKDGWGRITLLVGMGKLSVNYYRSLAPIYVDTLTNEFLDKKMIDMYDPLIIDLVHSRAASAGSPINIYSVQPFEYQTSTGSRLFLIHNGSVDKKGLASDIESLDRVWLERYSDSYVMGLWLARKLGDRIEPQLISELKRYVLTALNLGVLLIAPSRVQLLIGSYYREPAEPPKRDYYKLYIAELASSLVITSSTLVDFDEYRPRSIGSWRELLNGTYYMVDIPIQEAEEIKGEISSFNI